MKIIRIITISLLIVAISVFLVFSFIPGVQPKEIILTALSGLDMYNKIVGTIIVIGMIVIIIQNHLQQRKKKLYWQELSDEYKMFLKKLADAHPDIQKTIVVLLKHDTLESDEMLTEKSKLFSSASASHRVHSAQESRSNVMNEDKGRKDG